MTSQDQDVFEKLDKLDKTLLERLEKLVAMQGKEYQGFIGQDPSIKIGEPEEKMQESQFGGHRTAKGFRMDLIPRAWHRVVQSAVRLMYQSLGETLGYGEKKYGRHKEDPRKANWKGLDISTDQSPLNHAMDHLLAIMEGDRSEDHVGHLLANIAFWVWFTQSPDSPYRGMDYPSILASGAAQHLSEMISPEKGRSESPSVESS